MKTLKLIFQRDNSIAQVNPALLGSFVEHMGRAVYSGIYEPGHATADENGFRMDVAKLVQELGVTAVRYPGGNFVSGYNWQDGIGPKDQRPVRLDYAWLTKETNEFGINEFATWCEKLNLRPMIAVNLGTGTPQDAGYFIEYCNLPGGTAFSDLRRQHGREAPYDFKLWCLGNEMDGEWQTCALNAADYVKKARETAKIMRWVDPSVELVACGSSNSMQKTFPEWDRIVLEGLYDQVDYLSCHHYFENRTGVTRDYLASCVQMDNFIKTIIATADYVKARTRSTKDMMISFDEWNIWSLDGDPWQNYFSGGKNRFNVAPPVLEQSYTLLDALVFGGLMCTLLNHSDRVRMASLAQLVNVIAPIFTLPGGGVIRQTIFWPFRMVSQHAHGTVLKQFATVPQIDTCYGAANIVQTTMVYDAAKNEIAFFALNMEEKLPVEVCLELHDFGATVLQKHISLQGENLMARNSFESPEEVVPNSVQLSPEQVARNKVLLPPLSFNMVIIRTAPFNSAV